MCLGVPTGSGKTLPQLGTILLMQGNEKLILISSLKTLKIKKKNKKKIGSIDETLRKLEPRQKQRVLVKKKDFYIIKLQKLFQIVGKAIVIPPLVTIQVQMAGICDSWDIPYLNLSEINPLEIQEKIDREDPKILLASIEDITNPVIQSQIQNVDVSYIALDEAQVYRTM